MLSVDTHLFYSHNMWRFSAIGFSLLPVPIGNRLAAHYVNPVLFNERISEEFGLL